MHASAVASLKKKLQDASLAARQLQSKLEAEVARPQKEMESKEEAYSSAIADAEASIKRESGGTAPPSERDVQRSDRRSLAPMRIHTPCSLSPGSPSLQREALVQSAVGEG